MSASSCPICASNARSTGCALAADWADDERMAFLTSYTSPDDSNARDQLVSFWSKAVAHAFEEAPSLSLDLGLLARNSLAWGGASAPGLELAMLHMLESGKLVPRMKIEAEAGLANRLVVAPLVYLLGMVGLGAGTEKIPSGEHVHRGVLEALAEEVVLRWQRLPEGERTVYLLKDRLTTPNAQIKGNASPWRFEQLCRASAGSSSGADGVTSRLLSGFSSDDLAFVATYLVRTKRAVSEEGLIKLVKAGVGGGGSGTEAATAISETDKDLLRLRCTVASLQANVLDLGQRMQRSQLDAVRENRQGQKRAALVHMRRAKQFQSARDNRLSSLYTLETALDQVKQLRIDKQVLEAHDAATSALKACRKSQGLTVERVEDTLDALAEEMAQQQAIGAALSQDGVLLEDADERAALESELDELLQADAAADIPTASSSPAQGSIAAVANSKPPASPLNATDSVSSRPVVSVGVASVPGKTPVST